MILAIVNTQAEMLAIADLLEHKSLNGASYSIYYDNPPEFGILGIGRVVAEENS